MSVYIQFCCFNGEPYNYFVTYRLRKLSVLCLTRNPAIARKSDRTTYARNPASDFQSRRESNFSEMHAVLTERCLESYNER